jgi:hypothetical protein
MIHPLLFLVLSASPCAAGSVSPVGASSATSASASHALPADSLKTAYEGGQTWAAFYDAAERRRELWVRNWTNATVSEELVARARAAGSWRILVITEPGCSDSVNSVPYIAKLVEETPGLELRLVDSKMGRPWMEAHRSADGRAATPTVLVLDAEYEIRGCWIEQPAKLQAFWLPVVARGTTAEQLDEKMAWYAEDGGRETLRELVEVLEGAASGQVICPGLHRE